MEMSDEGPELGLVSTRIVSFLKPGTSSCVPPTVPSRWSEPRISHVEPEVFADPDSMS